MSQERTASPTINRILTGHFRTRGDYKVWRADGTHDWLLIHTLAGSGEFSSAARPGCEPVRFRTSAGDVVLIQPGTLHDYGTSPGASRWDLLWAHFHPRPDWRPWLDALPPTAKGLLRLSLSNVAERRVVGAALQKMNRLAVGPHPLSETLAMNALEEALLWCVRAVVLPRGGDPRIEAAEEYLCQHVREHVTLDQLADAVGLSVSRLAYLFRRQTGTTPQRYHESRRLERARQMLELTSLPIKSVAAMLGFESPAYFTTRFKRYAGKNPSEYRRT